MVEVSLRSTVLTAGRETKILSRSERLHNHLIRISRLQMLERTQPH
jgi:hypothetical protein